MEKFKPAKGDSEDSPLIDRTRVLQEAKLCFMANSVKSKKLVDILTKCITILAQEEKLTPKEATDLFFHITHLFQYKHKDNTLRRLTYIAIKALSQQAENIYVVTSSLTNDLDSISDPSIRAAALRALCRISDASTFASIEPYIKQGIVDKCPVVASAAIISLIRISSINSEAINRCSNEIQIALNSESQMVQYHALGLRYSFSKNDPQTLSRLISDCIQQGLQSPLAICLLIRIISEYISDHESEQTKSYCEYIKNNLNHQTEMVELEAARSLIGLKFISNESVEHKSAVAHLRNFLTSDKLSLRYASVRSLNDLSNSVNGSQGRFWSVHRIGGLCKLHLLYKHYRIGDQIIGLLDFTDANLTCAKYTVILQCEESQQYELKEEFSLGFKRSDILMTIPNLVKTDNKPAVLHCVLSFLFYIADQGNYSKTLFKDRAGTIELGPGELDTKLFSCDFPIAIHS